MYVLGHSDHELRRLSHQAGVIDPITRGFFVSAGIERGMRVLDVGSGAGDVSFLLADLVGPDGEVIGADLSVGAVETARARAEGLGLTNVAFVHGDPTELVFEELFDAVAGRYVLQFINEPAAALCKLVALARPGGVIVFHELDWDRLRPEPASPTYEMISRWVMPAIEAARSSVHMGGQLGRVFTDAGLANPMLRLEAPIAVGDLTDDLIRVLCDLTTTLLPTIERLGIATAAEIDVASLAERIAAEVNANGCVIVSNTQVGAWSRRPE